MLPLLVLFLFPTLFNRSQRRIPGAPFSVCESCECDGWSLRAVLYRLGTRVVRTVGGLGFGRGRSLSRASICVVRGKVLPPPAGNPGHTPITPLPRTSHYAFTSRVFLFPIASYVPRSLFRHSLVRTVISGMRLVASHLSVRGSPYNTLHPRT